VDHAAEFVDELQCQRKRHTFVQLLVTLYQLQEALRDSRLHTSYPFMTNLITCLFIASVLSVVVILECLRDLVLEQRTMPHGRVAKAPVH
jgi:hypothetical protein